MKAKNKKRIDLSKASQKVISIAFLIIFFIINIIVLFFSWIPYCTNRKLFFPNIVALLISILIGVIAYLFLRKINISKKAFYITISISFIVLFIIQIIILHFIYFRTGWDVNVVNTLADNVAENGIYTSAGHDPYLTFYPNNTFLVAVLAFIKSIPIIGEKYFFLLTINVLIVDLAGLLTCLTIKKLSGSYKTSLFSLIITIPLVLLSPWIIIPYSDTFSILFPILVFYIYLSTKQWWKYGLITFLSLIGYFIKPTAIIVLIAIIILELINTRRNKAIKVKKIMSSKKTWLSILSITNAICLAFLCKYMSLNYINYEADINTKPVSFVHYLAMGQNESNCGAFWEPDVIEAPNGTSFEIKKFCDRIIQRSIGEQIHFFAQKLLMNYNDGTYAWGGEGNFYYVVPERNSEITDILSSFFYSKGENNIYLSQLQQMLWLFVLFGSILFYKKIQTKEESVLQLALIGIFIFVMLFEARSRYLFCYSPLFITCSIVGYYRAKNYINEKIATKKHIN